MWDFGLSQQWISRSQSFGMSRCIVWHIAASISDGSAASLKTDAANSLKWWQSFTRLQCQFPENHKLKQTRSLWMNSGPKINVCLFIHDSSGTMEMQKEAKKKDTWMEPCQLLFIGGSLFWLLLYCLCPVPVVLTHSSRGVPSQETSCSKWCTVWWEGRTVGHAPPCTVHSGTLASHHSPRSTAYTCHSFCLAGHLVEHGTCAVVRQWSWEMVVEKCGTVVTQKLGTVVKQKLRTVVKQKYEWVMKQKYGGEAEFWGHRG